MKNKKRKSVGLALGSGGVRGLAHIGVIRTLLRNKIPIDYIAGSSAGAIAASYYSLNKEVDFFEKALIELRQDKIYSFVDLTFKGGILKENYIDGLVEKLFDNEKFSRTKIPLAVVATDIISGNPVIFTQGNIASAVRASVAIPLIFKPIKIDNWLLVDGGVSNPVPDDVVKKMGADIVISVNLSKHEKDVYFDEEKMNILNVTLRSVDLLMHYLTKNTLKDSDVIISPNFSEKGLNSWKKYFNGDSSLVEVETGERAADKQVEKIKALLK